MHLLKSVNTQDQRLQREKEIGRERIKKNEYFSNEKQMERLCIENYFTVSDSDYNWQFLPAASALVAKAEIFRWHWNPCPGLHAVRNTHAQKERVDRRQGAFKWLQREFLPDRFCFRPVMLQNHTTVRSFSKHFAGRELPLLLLGGRTAMLPEYVSSCHLSVPREIS